MSDEIVQGEAEAFDAGVSPAAQESTTAPAATTQPEPTPAPAASSEGDEFERAMRDLGMGSQYEKSLNPLTVGEVVSGIVMHVDREGAMVDVGAKSEGFIRPEEITREPNANIEELLKVGDQIRVYVLKTDDYNGRPELSKKRADFEQAWIRVDQARTDGKVIQAIVIARVKGGLSVDLGIRGFVPASHVGTGGLKNNLDKYVGQTLPLRVIEVDKERRKVVLSHKMALQEERQAKSEATKASLAPNQIRQGVVRRIVPYGAFIDLGGVDGLLHITEMSWTRINDPKEVLTEGQELDVMVLSVDLKADRVSLGLRQILPDPWTEIPGLYRVGDTAPGKITRVGAYGAFCLVGGVEGIIPHSELPRNRATRSVTLPNSGDDVEVKILDLRPDERKMKLSIRALIAEEPYAAPERSETQAVASAPAPPRESSSGSGGGGGRKGRKDRDRDLDEGYSRYVQDEEPKFTIGEALAAANKRKSERRERKRQEEDPDEVGWTDEE